MEKIKFYGEDGLIAELEPNDYTLRMLARVLASQLKEKITFKEAFLMALRLEEGYDGEKDLLEGVDMYELVAYFAIKLKVKSLREAWDENADEGLRRALNVFGAEKEQILIAVAYVSMCGFINDWDNE